MSSCYRVARDWLDREAGSSRVLYHIAKKPAQPKPYRLDIHGQWNHANFPPGTKVVFLTSDPLQVAVNHNRYGNVYAYRVPMSVIRNLGGMVRTEGAKEIVIPDYLWDQVDFLGKSKSESELANEIESKYTTSKAQGAWWEALLPAKIGLPDIESRHFKQNQAAQAYLTLEAEIAEVSLRGGITSQREVLERLKSLRRELTKFLYDPERKKIETLTRTEAREAKRLVSKYRAKIMRGLR